MRIIFLSHFKPPLRSKLLRTVKDLSSSLVAKKSGLGISRLSKFERGWVKLRFEEEEALATVLGVDVNELFGPVVNAVKKKGEENE